MRCSFSPFLLSLKSISVRVLVISMINRFYFSLTQSLPPSLRHGKFISRVSYKDSRVLLAVAPNIK